MELQNLTKYYGEELVFAKVDTVIGKDDHIGLVGANGVGKTTLLRIIAGEELHDSGELIIAQNYQIGYLKQLLEINTISLEEYLLVAFADLLKIQKQMEQLEKDLTLPEIYNDPSRLAVKMQQYAHVQQQWEEQGGYTYRAKMNQTVLGLGLALSDLSKPLSVLSGGEQVRAQFARLLLEEPDLLLLDEPSNHLDMEALEWLEDFLRDYKKAVIVVSHDRYFLDRFATRIWELADKMLYHYRGNYTAYLDQSQVRREQARQQAEKQLAEIEKIEAFARKFGAGTRARQAKSRAKKLEKLEPVVISETAPDLTFRFQAKRQPGNMIVEFDHISKAYDQVVLDQISGKIYRGERIALLGPNGSGKSTLLKILADQISYSGSLNWGVNVDLSYFNQTLEFEHNGTVLDELYWSYDLDHGKLRSVLARFLFKGDQVFQPIHELSGGERNRLLLAKIFLAAPNFLILDEPTNHLDLYAREGLEEALTEYDGTILFVSHDRYLVDLLATKLWILADGKLVTFEGNYSQYREYLKASQLDKQSKAKEIKKARQPRASLEAEKLAKERAALEARIIEVEDRKTELENLMAQPGFYDDAEQFKMINFEYQQVNATLEQDYRRWEELVDALKTKDDA